MKATNIKEFQALVRRYETITLEEIRGRKKFVIRKTANRLTGVGNPLTCSLCISVLFQCEVCVYGTTCRCCIGENKPTYDKMLFARTSEDLLRAFRDRAKHLRKNYSKYLDI